MKHARERVLRVFVAAPSDVDREVKILRKVVEKLNEDHGTPLRVRIEVLNWKTNVVPGLGSDAQAVINDQIGDNYDIFFGILWTRFGTATPRARSATEEEYERAVARWQEDHQIQVMVYFSDLSARPSHVSPDQLAKVQNFRKEIAKKSSPNVAALYCEFKNREDFKDLAQRHLATLMHKWSKTNPPRSRSAPPVRNITKSSFILQEKKVPFAGQQDADFVVRRIGPHLKGFRLSVTVPQQPYWRAGFALSSNDYIQSGRSDIAITRDFLFHIGRGKSSDPKKRTDLHWQVYGESQPLSAPNPFPLRAKVDLNVMFNQRRDSLVICFAGQRLEVPIKADYCRYLYVLAWADWFDDFRVPVTLKLLP